MPPISVIICTHNPREDYLRRVLEALRVQTLPARDWDLLLVDNASDLLLARRFDLSWHPNARHVREDKTGKTHALLRGVAEFQGELLIIVDDDNVLRADYLQASRKVAAEYPWLGAWGGSCIPEFEAEPPADLRPWLAGLVIEKLTRPYWANLPRGSEACPMGAGMVVRRRVAVRYSELLSRDPIRQTLGPGGKMPGGGDDTDMALCGIDLGLGTGRFPELELTHLIPARKLTLEYLETLNEGLGYAGVVLTALYDKLERFPGRIQSGALRIFLLRLLMSVLGKGRAERRIRLAQEKGAARARRELKRRGGLQCHPVAPS